MIKLLNIYSIICLLTTAYAGDFAHFINKLNNTPDSLKQAHVDSFYNAHARFPLIEQDTVVYFIYKGNATSVSWAGDANGWDPTASKLSNMSPTNLWYRQEIYESDARLDYKLVVNGTNWILDPKNSYTIRGGYGPNSELRMPDFQFPGETVYQMGISHGSKKDTTFYSAELGNSRKVSVYLPPGYNESNEFYPCIIVHDGLDYISLGSAKNVIDNLIYDKRIRPIIAIFIPAVNRTPEYAGEQRDLFADFIVNEILAWAKKSLRILEGRENKAIIGASNGGNISLYMALKFPHIFGNVAAQSSNVEDYVYSGYANADRLDLKIYLNLGKYDIPILIPRIQNFVALLQEKEYDYFYKLYPEGHSWGFWRAHIDDILEMFFPYQDTKVGHQGKITPEGFDLSQNYPNPFNGQTRLDISIDKTTFLSAQIYNIRGEQIRTLIQRPIDTGEHSLSWDGKNNARVDVCSGTYLLTILLNGSPVATRKVVLLR